MTKRKVFIGVLVLVGLVVLAVFGLCAQKKSNTPGPTTEEYANLTAEHAWFRWYFGEYAATLREVQYGEATLDINNLFVAHQNEFLKIQDLTTSLVCPASTNAALTKEYIYFGARGLPLVRKDGVDFYMASYTGNAKFAHSEKYFDAMFSSEDLAKHKRIDVTEAYGLMDRWMQENKFQDTSYTPAGEYAHMRPFSYNTGDVDGDGRDDFLFGTWLVLSSKNYERIADMPRETIFVNGKMVSVKNDQLNVKKWNGNEGVSHLSSISFDQPLEENLPHVLLPLTDEYVGLRTKRGLDVYKISDEGSVTFHGWVEGFLAGGLVTGGVGDFTGDGKNDVWLSEVATYVPELRTIGRIVLVTPEDIKEGRNTLSDIAVVTIDGSERYSDYDGIGTTLSPKAGDIDGDGKPDFSFTGHRHMNEAGALYVLFGKDIETGMHIDITDEKVIRILGRRMSQLAPPYRHWDATDIDGDGYDDIVVPADNDLCSGLNAGAIYVVSGKKITEAR